jgi:hypothetical protein
MRLRNVVTLVANLVLAAPAMAQVADDDQPPTWHVEARAAREPAVALNYVLLPPAFERRAGNAAVLYNKLAIEFPPYGEKEEERARLMSNWLRVPMQELPVEEIRAFLKRYQEIIADLRSAACCESCNWQPPMAGQDFHSMRIPETQAMRGLANLVALQARLHIRAGRFDEALALLQTGFAMARHISQHPSLISALFGIAIAEVMESRIFDWIRQPESPNLYWALTALPQPFIDYHSAAGVESRWLFFSFQPPQQNSWVSFGSGKAPSV